MSRKIGPDSNRPFNRPFAARSGRHGFTLVEILVVVAIAAVIMALVAQRVVRASHQAKRQATRTTLSHAVAAVEQYSLDNGRPPEHLGDLARKPGGAFNWNGPYLDEPELRDAWGRELVYRNPGERREFDVLSYGADGRPGGEGPEAEDVTIR